MSSYDIKVAVPVKDEAQAKEKAKVIKSFTKSLSDEDFALLAKKIKENPQFFQSITPYLKMI